MRRARQPADSPGLRRDVVSAWLYVRLGAFGEIQAVQGEGIEDPAIIARFAYAEVEPLPGRFGPLQGWIRSESSLSIVVAKLHRSGISRVFLMLRQAVRRRPMIKSLVDEAESLIERCDAHTLSGTYEAAATRSMPIIGMIHVSGDLTAKAWWFTQDASLARLLSVVHVHEDGSLQPQVAALYRALTQTWDAGANGPASATFGALLPGIIMHVFPAQLDGAVATLIFEHVRMRRSLREAFAEFSITSREAQVIRLLMSGHSVREAATILSIAESTTHDHIKSVLTKTHARNRAQMISILLGYEGVQVRPPGAQTSEAGAYESGGSHGLQNR